MSKRQALVTVMLLLIGGQPLYVDAMYRLLFGSPPRPRRRGSSPDRGSSVDYTAPAPRAVRPTYGATIPAFVQVVGDTYSWQSTISLNCYTLAGHEVNTEGLKAYYFMRVDGSFVVKAIDNKVLDIPLAGLQYSVNNAALPLIQDWMTRQFANVAGMEQGIIRLPDKCPATCELTTDLTRQRTPNGAITIPAFVTFHREEYSRTTYLLFKVYTVTLSCNHNSQYLAYHFNKIDGVFQFSEIATNEIVGFSPRGNFYKVKRCARTPNLQWLIDVYFMNNESIHQGIIRLPKDMPLNRGEYISLKCDGVPVLERPIPASRADLSAYNNPTYDAIRMPKYIRRNQDGGYAAPVMVPLKVFTGVYDGCRERGWRMYYFIRMNGEFVVKYMTDKESSDGNGLYYTLEVERSIPRYMPKWIDKLNIQQGIIRLPKDMPLNRGEYISFECNGVPVPQRPTPAPRAVRPTYGAITIPAYIFQNGGYFSRPAMMPLKVYDVKLSDNYQGGDWSAYYFSWHGSEIKFQKLEVEGSNGLPKCGDQCELKTVAPPTPIQQRLVDNYFDKVKNWIKHGIVSLPNILNDDPTLYFRLVCDSTTLYAQSAKDIRRSVVRGRGRGRIR